MNDERRSRGESGVVPHQAGLGLVHSKYSRVYYENVSREGAELKRSHSPSATHGPVHRLKTLIRLSVRSMGGGINDGFGNRKYFIFVWCNNNLDYRDVCAKGIWRIDQRHRRVRRIWNLGGSGGFIKATARCRRCGQWPFRGEKYYDGFTMRCLKCGEPFYRGMNTDNNC